MLMLEAEHLQKIFITMLISFNIVAEAITHDKSVHNSVLKFSWSYKIKT